MQCVLTDDKGKVTTFNNITDLYLAVRQNDATTDGDKVVFVPQTRSYSWGGNLRELAKELQQSLTELQDVLRELRHGGKNRE